MKKEMTPKEKELDSKTRKNTKKIKHSFFKILIKEMGEVAIDRHDKNNPLITFNFREVANFKNNVEIKKDIKSGKKNPFILDKGIGKGTKIKGFRAAEKLRVNKKRSESSKNRPLI